MKVNNVGVNQGLKIFGDKRPSQSLLGYNEEF